MLNLRFRTATTVGAEGLCRKKVSRRISTVAGGLGMRDGRHEVKGCDLRGRAAPLVRLGTRHTGLHRLSNAIIADTRTRICKRCWIESIREAMPRQAYFHKRMSHVYQEGAASAADSVNGETPYLR